MTEPAAVLPPLSDEEIEAAYHDFFAEEVPLYCGLEDSAAFVSDLCAHLPAEEGAALLRNFEGFLAGNPGSDKAWRSILQLAKVARARGLDDVLARHEARVVGDQLDQFIAFVNAGTEARSVVFVAHQPYFLIMREAMYLRRNGHRVCLISYEPISANLRPLFEAAFDAVIDTRRSYPLLRRLLSRLRPAVFHVQCWMWSYFLGRLALELRGDAAVVGEFYDITSIYAPRDVLASHWSREMVDLDLAMERFVLQGADAVIGRFPEAIAARWMEGHEASAPYLRMLPYACAEFTDYGDGAKYSDADGVTRLVYAGSIIVDPPHLYPEAGTAAGFERLLAQGLAIDVLHNPHQPVRREDPAYADFFALMDRFPRFRIVDGVPPDELSRALAPYDFGIHLFEYDLEAVQTREDQRRGVVSTKIFSYLEAGLPVLMNAEYEEMARILEDGGFGLGIATGDLDRVAERIAGFDTAAAVAAIKAFNEEHGMDREIHRLIGLYDRITGTR